LRLLNARGNLEGELHDLGFLDAATDGIEGKGGAGHGRLDLQIVDGSLKTAHATADSKDARVSAGGHTVAASGQLTLRAEEGKIAAEAIVAPIAVEYQGRTLARAHSTKVGVRLHDARLEHLLDAPSIVADLPEAELPDARAFNPYLSPESTFRFEGGHGLARAHLDMTGAAANGRASLAGTDIAFRVRDAHVRGSGTIDVEGIRAPSAPEIADLPKVVVDLHDVRVDDAEPWSMHLRAPGANARLAKKVAFAGTFSASAPSARPLVALFAKKTPLPAWSMALFTNVPASATGRVQVQNDFLALRELRGKVGDRFELAGDFSRHGDRSQSIFLVTSGPFGVGVESSAEGTRVEPWSARDWFTKAEPTFR
jgi:hypothetical protein